MTTNKEDHSSMKKALSVGWNFKMLEKSANFQAMFLDKSIKSAQRDLETSLCIVREFIEENPIFESFFVNKIEDIRPSQKPIRQKVASSSEEEREEVVRKIIVEKHHRLKQQDKIPTKPSYRPPLRTVERDISSTKSFRVEDLNTSDIRSSNRKNKEIVTPLSSVYGGSKRMAKGKKPVIVNCYTEQEFRNSCSEKERIKQYHQQQRHRSRQFK